MGIIYLAAAILSEVFGSAMMKLTATVKSNIAIAGVVAGYLLSFYLLSLALLTIPLSFAYAVWSGLGTALTATAGLIGVLLFDEILTRLNILGLFIIIAGVILMNLSLKTDQKNDCKFQA